MMSETTQFTAAVHKGCFGFDARHEFEVVRVSPDGFEVTIEYTADGERATFQRNRFVRQNGELRLA
jgi:hypothetical protein